MRIKHKRVFCTFLVGIAALLAISCGLSTDDLAKEVQADIESTFAEREYDVEIEDFTLVKKSDTEYRGILEVSADGETVSLAVNVTVDGDSFMWEIDQ